jgi:hypothetical protein
VRRRLTWPVLAILAIVLAACSSPAAAADPYDLVSQSSKAAWDVVQVNVGLNAKGDGQTVTIDKSAIAFVVDSKAGKGAVHISIPASAVGVDAMTLTMLGATSGSIDFDAVFDGDALYARSPLLAMGLKGVFTEPGSLPSGDLSGWLRLGTKADLAGLAGLGGAGALPSVAPTGGSGDLKADLQSAGVTLSTAGVDQVNGAASQHLKVAIDSEKLLASPMFDSASRSELSQAKEALAEIALSADVWVDQATKHLVQVDLHGAPKSGASGSVDLSISLRAPDGSISLAAPAEHVDLPTQSLMQGLMQLVGSGLTGS